jgi:hypothetical protein
MNPISILVLWQLILKVCLRFLFGLVSNWLWLSIDLSSGIARDFIGFEGITLEFRCFSKIAWNVWTIFFIAQQFKLSSGILIFIVVWSVNFFDVQGFTHSWQFHAICDGIGRIAIFESHHRRRHENFSDWKIMLVSLLRLCQRPLSQLRYEAVLCLTRLYRHWLLVCLIVFQSWSVYLYLSVNKNWMSTKIQLEPPILK